jgi:hypothetical protein
MAGAEAPIDADGFIGTTESRALLQSLSQGFFRKL